MKQLTMGNILDCVNVLKQQGMSVNEIVKLPIYIGNDEELNGIHTGWYINIIDNDDDSQDLRDMINEDRCSIELADNMKAILIS